MTTNEQAKEQGATNNGEGSQSTATSYIEQARKEREGLERVRDELKAEREKIEQLRAESILGGNTQAGQQPKKQEEISAQDYAKSALKGQIK